MSTISVQEMEQNPLGCLKRVEAGETLTVLRDNQPVAEIKPPASPAQPPLPYGQPPQLTSPDDLKIIVSRPPWEKLLAALATQNIWVEVVPVCAYLDHFPDVADVSAAICQSTRKEFGPEAVLALEINRDPEIDDRYLKLRVSLPTFGPDVDQRLDAVAHAHEDQLWDKKGYILVTTGRQLNR